MTNFSKKVLKISDDKFLKENREDIDGIPDEVFGEIDGGIFRKAPVEIVNGSSGEILEIFWRHACRNLMEFST